MKVLIAAKRLAADRTSEGICSSKYVAALAAGGHDVRCLTAEETIDSAQRLWHADAAPITMVGRGRRLSVTRNLARLTARLASTGSAGAYSSRKLNGLSARATGYSLLTWELVERWRVALQQAIRAEQPAVLVVRGAGREFEPHMAMLGWHSPVPWIAHYHDPYPGSLYPEPYRQHVALQSPRQEQVHRRIVQSASALTFPSQRLLEWVLRGELEPARDKAFVVPHLAGDPVPGLDTGRSPTELEAGRLNIVHTGTMLRERDPRPLLRGFLRFAESEAERQRLARLVFVGRIDSAHTQSEEWRRLSRMGLLRMVDHRISYRAALAVSRAADCLIILEAKTPESPFFPAKLADYLWLDKPILAASPAASATADILGADYPLLVDPANHQGATAVFERLWDAWRAGRLSELRPPAALGPSMSASAVAARTGDVFDFLLKGPRTHEGQAA